MTPVRQVCMLFGILHIQPVFSVGSTVIIYQRTEDLNTHLDLRDSFHAGIIDIAWLITPGVGLTVGSTGLKFIALG